MTREARYNRDDQNACAEARQRVSAAILPMVASAETRDQAFIIAMSAVSGALGLAVGAFAALHDLELAEVDELTLAEECLKMMREVRQQ